MEANVTYKALNDYNDDSYDYGLRTTVPTEILHKFRWIICYWQSDVSTASFGSLCMPGDDAIGRLLFFGQVKTVFLFMYFKVTSIDWKPVQASKVLFYFLLVFDQLCL